jgi:hypothetical protein
MLEAVSTSEMSVNFYQTTRRNIPKDSHLYNLRREILMMLPGFFVILLIQPKKTLG